MTLLDLTTAPARSDRLDGLPVAIIGAGPVGLAAAANLVERGIDFVIYEAGDSVAHSVAHWGHVRLFSPWSLVIDPASRRLLEATGWTHPDLDALPTGRELVEQYLVPLASLDAIAARIRTGTEVIGVSRQGLDRTRTADRATTPFVLRLRTHGEIVESTARAVIDASGTYRTPNSLGSSGLAPLGVEAVADLVLPALPDVLGRDREHFAGRHTTVVGAGHSAATTLLALAELAELEPGTRVSWLIRSSAAARITSADDDGLPARASLGARIDALVAVGTIELLDRVEIVALERRGGGARIIGARTGAIVEHDTDLIVNATGFRPDLSPLREVRLDLDEVVEAPAKLAPLIDPNVHSCGTVEPHGFAELQQPEPGFFLAGMKSYGRAPTFLLATGYEQVRSITAWLAGDMAAALAVQLTLPATGVCSTAVACTTEPEASACCG